MIKDNLFPTDTNHENRISPHTEMTQPIPSMNLTTLPLQYSVGYIRPDKIPHYHKLSKVEVDGNTITLTSINKKENSDVLLIASGNRTGTSNNTSLAFVDGYLKAVKYSNENYGNADNEVRLVNNVNITETATNYSNISLIFYACGRISGVYKFGWGEIVGFSNIYDFITGKTKVNNFRIAKKQSDERPNNNTYIPEISIDDFENGLHTYEYENNGYTDTMRVWIAGIRGSNVYLPDTWQGKTWRGDKINDTIGLKIGYSLETDDNIKYLSFAKLDRFPTYSQTYGFDLFPNYLPVDNIVNTVYSNAVYADIDCSVNDEPYTYLNSPYGNNWIYLNNDGYKRFYYCCNASEIMSQLAQIPRALINSEYTYNNNPDAYTVNNNFCYSEVTADNEYTGRIVIPDSVYDVQPFQNTNDITNYNAYDYNNKPAYRPDIDSDFGDLVSNIGRNIQTVSTGKLYKIGISDATKVLNVIGGTYSTDTILSASDGLISFQYFPFNIPSANVSQTAKIGAYNDNGTIRGFPLPADVQYLQITATSFMIDLGSTRINALYNDFRDFPPYSTYNAFIPFVNQSYTIDFAVFKNHTVSFQLIVDVLTGSGIVCILRDGLLYDTINGTVATQISINSADVAQYNASVKATENAMQSNELNAKLAMINMVSGLTSAVVGGSSINLGGAVSAVTGGLSAVTNAALNRDMLQYQLDTMQVHHSLIQSASANCGNQLEREVHIIIAHAKMLPDYNESIYSKTVGYACCKNDLIANCSNFTQVSEINLTGINCTDVEKNLIKSALMQGVVIK